MPPRPPKGSHATANQHAYIPQGAQAALSRQMQQSVPAHLKQYVNNPNGYVPPRVQQELTTYMEAALPQHLQQYAGAYVEQNVVMPSMMQRPGAATTETFRPNKPINPRNLSHSGNVGSEQGDATRMLELFQPEHQKTAAQATPAPATPEPANPPQYPAGQLSQPYHADEAPAPNDPAHYDFIMNPAPPSKPAGGGSSSLGIRLAVVAGVGLVLLIAIIVVSSLLKGGNTGQADLLVVAQQQTELLRVASQAQAHSSNSQSLQLAGATTINLTTAQAQTLSYFKTAKIKYTPQQLNLKHNAQTDNALNTAVATNTFDTVFQQVIQQDLAAYRQSIQQAYKSTTGPKGRALLKTQYNGASLLLKQAQES